MGLSGEQVRDGWRDVFSCLEKSGLSAAGFCRREGFPYWKLMYWKKRLGLVEPVYTPGPAFAEVVVEKTADTTARRAVLEIALPGGAMLTLRPSIRIYICLRPADMRKQMDGLSAMVASEMDEDPLSGNLFLFPNRRGDRLKIVY